MLIDWNLKDMPTHTASELGNRYTIYTLEQTSSDNGNTSEKCVTSFNSEIFSDCMALASNKTPFTYYCHTAVTYSHLQSSCKVTVAYKEYDSQCKKTEK